MVNFKGIGVFPKLKFPRVIWIGTDENGGNLLVELAKKIENALTPLGFSVDKPFKPHITVFRIKNKLEILVKNWINSNQWIWERKKLQGSNSNKVFLVQKVRFILI